MLVTALRNFFAVTAGSSMSFTRPASDAADFDIFAATTGRTIAEIEVEYEGHGYGDFKKDVAEAVVDRLTPIRTRTLELLEDPAELDRLLAIGAERAAERAERMLRTVYDRVGFVPRG